ncbi:MAG TPA: ATP-binding protein [Candidatus Binatia bacterium]
MAAKRHNFEELFRTPDPFVSDGFRLFLREVAGARDSNVLRDFFIRLNGELYRASWVENGAKVPWADEMLAALVNANPQLTLVVLRDLLDEMKLHYQDPLTEVLFQTASKVPVLLSLLGEIVQKQGQLVQLRVRALEALFTRLSLGRRPLHAGTGIEDTLRSFNEILQALKRETVRGATKGHERLSQDLQAVNRLLPSLTRGRLADSPEAGAAQTAYREILDILQSVLQQSSIAPPSAHSTLTILKILRANTPLPAWHPSASPWSHLRSAQKQPGKGLNGRDASQAGVAPEAAPTIDSPGEDSKVILALIIDRAIAIVLEIAVAGWRPETGRPPTPKPSDETMLNPSDPPLLESVLLDPKSQPKTRNMAAALLSLLNYALASVQLSPRAEFYTRLFLMPYRSGGIHYRLRDDEDLGIVDAEEKLDFLFEALDEESDYVRWNAATLCYRCAREHPEWFKPKHYIKLMSLLSDEHYGIRLDMMRTIRTLSAFRNQEIFTVIHDISGKLAEKVYRVKDKERARVDLETALGVSLATLLERVDELQGEVLRLENRREHLLTYLEKQALRIGEEIHNEVLNTLCGYLATAIDERDIVDAQGRLKDVVTELRRIMNHLYPKDLEAEGFLATIRKRLEDAKVQMRRRNAKFSVDFDCPPDITDDTITASLRDKSHLVLLYRIASEALINARKHSHGTSIAVRVRRPRLGVVELSVSDNGRGGGGPFEESFGIDLMHRRAEDIGADIEYKKSSPAGGTTVVIRLADATKTRSHNPSKLLGVI